MEFEVRNAYVRSAGKPEGQNLDVMYESQMRYEACTLNVYRGGFSDEQPLKVGIRNRCFRNCFFFHRQSLT